MEIRREITIDADPQTVWKYFDDPDLTRDWQPTLQTQVHKQGTPVEPGAIAELVCDHDGRELRVVATVTEKRDHELLALTYESD